MFSIIYRCIEKKRGENTIRKTLNKFRIVFFVEIHLMVIKLLNVKATANYNEILYNQNFITFKLI